MRYLLFICMLMCSVNAYAINCEELYRNGTMKESEWREHQARQDQWFKERHTQYKDRDEYRDFNRQYERDRYYIKRPIYQKNSKIYRDRYYDGYRFNSRRK